MLNFNSEKPHTVKSSSQFSLHGKKTSNKGFTLVELIVVLVVLALLAAILVPSLLGYIEKAKEERVIPKAKNCFDAAQATASHYYGITTDSTGYYQGAKASNTTMDTFWLDYCSSKRTLKNQKYAYMQYFGDLIDVTKLGKFSVLATVSKGKVTSLSYHDETANVFVYWNGEAGKGWTVKKPSELSNPSYWMWDPDQRKYWDGTKEINNYWQ